MVTAKLAKQKAKKKKIILRNEINCHLSCLSCFGEPETEMVSNKLKKGKFFILRKENYVLSPVYFISF